MTDRLGIQVAGYETSVLSAYSGESGHLIQCKPATQSRAFRPPLAGGEAGKFKDYALSCQPVNTPTVRCQLLCPVRVNNLGRFADVDFLIDFSLFDGAAAVIWVVHLQDNEAPADLVYTLQVSAIMLTQAC